MGKMKVKRTKRFHHNRFGQTWDGKENYDLQKDKGIKAKKVGKRVSESGNVYFESRRNRSDAKGHRI